MVRKIVFDIESAKTVEDVGGWINKHKMGIAVLCATDIDTGERFVFSDDYEGARPLSELYDLFNGCILIGYNIRAFDMRLLLEQFLKEGHDLETFKVGIFDLTVKRLALGNITKAMFEDEKLMKGADAPLEWKKGGDHKKKVVEYCMDDVIKTLNVFNHGIASGSISYFDDDGIRRQHQVDWGEDFAYVIPKNLTPECVGGFNMSKKKWQCARCAFKMKCIDISR